MSLVALQREAKLQLFREAVDVYAALTNQVSEINSHHVFALCYLLMSSFFKVSYYFLLCLGAQRAWN